MRTESVEATSSLSVDSVTEGALALAPPPYAESEVRERLVAERYGRRDGKKRRLLAIADCLAVVTALLTAAGLSHRALGGAFVLGVLVSLPGWVLLLKAYGLYDRDVKRISHNTVDDIPAVFHALVIGGLMQWLVLRFLLATKLALLEMTWFGVSALVLMLGGRAIARAVSLRLGPERVLLVGGGGTVEALTRKLQAHPEYGLEPAGTLSTGHERPSDLRVPTLTPAPPLPVLGRLEDIAELSSKLDIERLIISPEGIEEADLLRLLRRCKGLALKVSILPAMFDVMGSSVEIDEVEGVTVLGLNPPVLARSSRFLKRSMDVAGSGLLLLLTLPVSLLIAIAVRLDSPGPVFFRQRRTGLHGKEFELLKFRTMVVDAEARRESLLHLSEDPNWLKLEQDPRITRVGRRLRTLSLDELPQLWNVLKGDMSLVGPRPLVQAEDALVEDWGRARLDLTPGMTGLWQVLGRTNIPFEEMVKLDYLYVTNWSLWMDIRLVLRTFPVVITRRGVN